MTARSLTSFPYDDCGGKWPFVLRRDACVNLGLELTGSHWFECRGQRIAHLSGDMLTIHAGYASDGASPYFGKLFGLRIGTPSHARTAAAFFTHDLLYQIADCPCQQLWTYRDADKVLHDLMSQRGSCLGGAYHAGVAIFGGLHRRLKKAPNFTTCLTHWKH